MPLRAENFRIILRNPVPALPFSILLDFIKFVWLVRLLLFVVMPLYRVRDTCWAGEQS